MAATFDDDNIGTASVTRALICRSDEFRTAGSRSQPATTAPGWELRDALNNALVRSGTGWRINDHPATRGFPTPTTCQQRQGADGAARRRHSRPTHAGQRRCGAGDVTDAYANVLADIDVRSTEASSGEASTAIAPTRPMKPRPRSASTSDEEAARLIQFQQGYRAAARCHRGAVAVRRCRPGETTMNASTRRLGERHLSVLRSARSDAADAQALDPAAAIAQRRRPRRHGTRAGSALASQMRAKPASVRWTETARCR